MALTPYENHKNSLNRSRSSSCSSPIRNRIVYQEVFSVGQSTLLRSYSCDQVFDKDDSGRSFQTTKIQVSNFITLEKNILKTYNRNNKIQIKPKKLEINHSNTDNSMTRKHVKKNSASAAEKCNVYKKVMKTIKYIIFPIICSCLFYLYISYRECAYLWDIEQTENDLNNNIIGQNDAIAKISSVLKLANNSDELLSLVFTGGVGVGKSYSSSIIMRNFPWSSQKLLVFTDSFYEDFKNILKSDFSTCRYNLIIVDDLSVENAKDVISMLKSLQIKKKSNEKLLLIFIFKVLSEEDKNEIISKFKSLSTTFFHIPFSNLNENAVEECFKREILRQKVYIPKQELDKLVKHKMAEVNIVRGTTGCKGVADEVSSYYKKNK